jgi:iron-sulfur cluster repair protein YtfE (RIC family)
MEKITNDIELDCHWSVGAVLERYASTAAVFNRHGIDMCCGSSVSVREAAQRDGVDAEELCAELKEAAAATA